MRCKALNMRLSDRFYENNGKIKNGCRLCCRKNKAIGKMYVTQNLLTEKPFHAQRYRWIQRDTEEKDHVLAILSIFLNVFPTIQRGKGG